MDGEEESEETDETFGKARTESKSEDDGGNIYNDMKRR
jgi:hypothetical protein